MDVSKHVSYWRDGAREDLDAARDLVEKGHHRHGLFFAHLAIEKTLKGLVVSKTGEMPPKSHDLLQLAVKAGVEIPEERARIMARVSRYCMEGRYPEAWTSPPDSAGTMKILAEAVEIVEWLNGKF